MCQEYSIGPLLFSTMRPLERLGLLQRILSRSRRPHYVMLNCDEIEQALNELG